MTVQAVLLPVFVLVFLTFTLMFWSGSRRLTAIRRGDLSLNNFALGPTGVPDDIKRYGNAFDNQFQIPVLFYVLVALALPLRQADLLFVLLSWVFVTLRVLHAVIYVGANNVRHRFYTFAASALLVLAMWVMFALKILLAI